MVVDMLCLYVCFKPEILVFSITDCACSFCIMETGEAVLP